MKLRNGFITYDTGDEQIMVPTRGSGSSFRGMARGNRTAAFIVDCLREETTRDAIIARMEETYDTPRDILAADADMVLDALRSMGALDE
jgi:hypothetical protein